MTTLDSPPSEWDLRIQAALDAYPSVGAPLTREDTERLVGGEELLVRLIREALAIDNVEIRRGTRPDPDVDDGMALLRELRGEDYTVEPFVIAFRALVGTRTLTNVARRTGLSKTTLSRLQNGVKQPTVAELDAIAGGFGKRPAYFLEYRAAVLAAVAHHYLTTNPDRSAVLAHQVGMGR